MPCAGLRHEHARCGRLITKLRPLFSALNVGDDSTDPAQMKLGTLPNTSSSTKLTRSDPKLSLLQQRMERLRCSTRLIW